jgi:hypothetical protein
MYAYIGVLRICGVQRDLVDQIKLFMLLVKVM